MSRLVARLRQEEGIALVMALMLGLLLSVVSVGMLAVVTSETTRSAHAVVRETSFQAAEAGVDAYTSKLLENNTYYVQQVAVGESTRLATNGTSVAAGGDWNAATLGTTWTYPTQHNAWASLSNGYEYNLQVAPPDGSGSTSIFAVGRRAGDTNTTNWREIQVVVRPSSLAEFYRVVDEDVDFGSSTTTNGKVYANGDIDHKGTAAGNLYAQGDVTGSVTLTNGAKIYDDDTNPSFHDVMPTPIDFSTFLSSLTDLNAASQDTASGGKKFDQNGKAWIITFQPNGTFTVKGCNTSGVDLDDDLPTSGCTALQTYQVPANGAIYSPQPVIVSGTVVGRVTVGSNTKIYVAGNIYYGTPGQDVLGLIAKEELVIGEYAPDDLTWSAAVIVQEDTWRTASQNGSHDTMNFTGMAATKDGGHMGMYDEDRIYNYDTNLHQMPPPWFPVVQDSYTTVLFRELAPS
ncbi:MAG TPA: hypothetical protein VH721_08585 [Gaiellaceae bacterium]